MNLEQQIEKDLKAALLASDRIKVATLRSLKNALLYAKVGENSRSTALTNETVISILSKEAKKRQESADLYSQAGEAERTKTELAEKAIIDTYLPAQLAEDDIMQIVDQTIDELSVHDTSSMGKVIGIVKQKTTGAADGATIARLVRERLSQE